MSNTSFLVLISATLCIFTLVWFILRLIKKTNVIRHLLKDFKRKISMTISLGVSFFGFYFLLIMIGTSLIKKTEIDLFLIAYEHPIECIYCGLFTFAFLSLGIYFIRMLVKYRYAIRSRDF